MGGHVWRIIAKPWIVPRAATIELGRARDFLSEDGQVTHGHSTGMLRAVLLGLVVLGPGFQPIAKAQRGDADFLHVLLACDTDALDQTKIDGNRLNNRLMMEIPRERREITVYQGGRVTSDDILDYYKDLRVRSNDALFFYFSGHGGVDGDGHFMRMTDGRKLWRDEVREAMEDTGARLRVLLTDCCALAADPGARVRAVFMPEGVARVEAFRHLFFRHRGTVDVNACKEGEEAWCDLENGGVCTDAFLILLGWQNHMLDSENSRDQFVSWREFLGHLDDQTNTCFQELKKANPGDIRQREQRLEVYDDSADPVSTRIARSRYRFGINTFDRGGEGVLIGEVYRDSPAEWHGFRKGEILYEIAKMAPETGDVLEVFRVRRESDFARIIDDMFHATLLRCKMRDDSTGDTRTRYVWIASKGN